MSTPKRKRCKYPHYIAVRIDDDLFEKINNEAIAADITPSEYIRQQLKRGRVTVKQEIVAEVPQLKRLIAEFGKIGSNINQIAHYFNAGGPFDAEIEKRLMEALSMLYGLKFEVEKMGGEFRGYSEAHLRKKQ